MRFDVSTSRWTSFSKWIYYQKIENIYINCHEEIHARIHFNYTKYKRCFWKNWWRKDSGKWCCCREEHKDGNPHYHLALKLNKQRRWTSVRSYISLNRCKFDHKDTVDIRLTTALDNFNNQLKWELNGWRLTVGTKKINIYVSFLYSTWCQPSTVAK